MFFLLYLKLFRFVSFKMKQSSGLGSIRLKVIQKLHQAETAVTENLDKQQTCPFKTKGVEE